MKLLVAVSYLFITFSAGAQVDSLVYKTITAEMAKFKPDYSTPPDDKLTKKIKEVIDLKGGFNINEAIAFKLEEDRKENKIPEAEWRALATYMTGEGASKINNAVIWIYRSHFTYKDLKQLVKFYSTSAGKKMNEVFPLLMLKSLMAAEYVKENYQNK